jgi:predicted nucleic acid-binding protein
MILVDSNIVLDVVTADERWLAWTLDQLNAAHAAGGLVANDIVYAEASVRVPTKAEVDDIFATLRIDIVAIPKHALFLAGKAFGRYRRSGGSRSGILPDFLIGAHAEVAGVPLLTRDVGRYRTYFPQLELIAP